MAQSVLGDFWEVANQELEDPEELEEVGKTRKVLLRISGESLSAIKLGW